MRRLRGAWSAMDSHQRPAVIAAACLLLTMFLPWYGLQSVSRKAESITSTTISAFGDVSFVEAAIFLVAVGVIVMLIARAEGRDFQLPGGDGTIVMLAGGWAALLIFYRVFDRPPGNGYPVSIEWGFFLAFVAAGALTYTGWRMRTAGRPQAPLSRPARTRRPPPPPEPAEPPRRRSAPDAPAAMTPAAQQQRRRRPEPVPARERRPVRDEQVEQLSFEDAPTRPERPPGPPAPS